MDYNSKIDKLFDERCFTLSEEQIIKMNRTWKSGDLNNVVVGLNNQLFAIFLDDDDTDNNFKVVYINGKIKLEGHILILKINEEEREGLTFYFSKYLAQFYPHLDVIDTFNTFQGQTRSLMEQIGYLTITQKTLEGYNNPTIITKGKKGVKRVTILNKVDFYKDFFGESTLRPLAEKEKYVYLMYNTRNNHFKIGSSKHTHHREKTLQAEEPEIELITFWNGSVKLEKQLHRQYASKRQRGEWFNLNFTDLHELKDTMAKL